ncbi:LOG family protein [Roseibium aggregatum]|uniref:AMP nucleosidase n=1 Tax=Roseibium aggregatum TaxID=187304 RepID=A0A0M6YE08_9HYPH|nr:LOG family protein [Roseibium aggregatum]CTQ47251.1 putative lysine decarboxylase [Roseibium aggregatum]
MKSTTPAEETKPVPANPDHRMVQLPWQSVKPNEDDPRAELLVRALTESPEYRQADEDIAFLNRDDTRPIRLQLDYFKAERLLVERGITDTIVVFGGTRLREPAAANRQVRELEALLRRAPDDADLLRQLRIAISIREKSKYYEIARSFGRLVGKAGSTAGKRLALMTGGGPGIMEAANRGAHEAGAPTIGLNILLPHEQYPNPYVTPGLCFRFHYFAIRKLHFLLRARALVVFPGGFGTLDELFETLTLIQTRKVTPIPVILVGQEFWAGIFNPELLADEGMIDAEDLNLFWYAETAEEIWQDIIRWYSQAGKPLCV